jgi:uncharacterized protein (TIGR02145 family)
MKSSLLLILLTIILFPLDIHSQISNSMQPQRKIALVIGNGNYLTSVLSNPENDARAMTEVLEKLGFVVDKYENLNQGRMKKAIDEFGVKLKYNDVALFYYAGHGIQSNGYNFLIPIDVQLTTEKQVEYECVQVDRILAMMEGSNTKVNIIIMDACRNNPFERSWTRSAAGRGLASMTAPKGTVISYATQPGNTASDGSGIHGLYTSAILESILVPNITIIQMFQQVRNIVLQKSNDRQMPWESTSLIGDFYLNPMGTINPEIKEKIQDTPIVTLPTLATLEISNISSFGLSSKVTIINDGGDFVSARGVCWSTTSDPTISNSKTIDGSGTGSFKSDLTGLTPGKTYYVRAYATNSAGTKFSNQVSFKTIATMPAISTATTTSITLTTALSGGTIGSEGGATVISRGVCWSKSANPTIGSNKTTDGTGMGKFVSSINGLTAGTTYYIRAYATTNVGTGYGSSMSFTTKNSIRFNPDLTYGTVSDIDSNEYKTITIGTQTWMAENLKTTKYNDGTSKSNVTDNGSWGKLTSPAYCWYNNDAATYKATYGALYNWYTVQSGKLCPTGWHIPSYTEWNTLITFLGRWKGSGNLLKETGTVHWQSPNDGATNESGFTALPGGDRDSSGSFYGIGYYNGWWSSTEKKTGNVWIMGIYSDGRNIERTADDIKSGYSVRCVLDK